MRDGAQGAAEDDVIPRRTRPKRKGGSRFPSRRDPAYKRWCYEQYDCAIKKLHECWAERDFAHVFETQARGAEDFANGVILCRAAHREQENRTKAFIATYGVDIEVLAVQMAARYLQERSFT